MARCCSLWCLLKWTIILIIGSKLTVYWLQHKSYLIDEQELIKTCKKHVLPGLNATEIYRRIHADLYKQYPGHILPAEDLEWNFLNAGGWMTSMCPIYGTMTEYIIFFGAAIESTGHHSGRYHWANLTDVVLTGEFQGWEADQLEARVYKPGDHFNHFWGDAIGVRFGAGTWMVEYARGAIPTTLNTALADIVFCTQDYYSLYLMARAYWKTTVLEIGTSLASWF